MCMFKLHVWFTLCILKFHVSAALFGKGLFSPVPVDKKGNHTCTPNKFCVHCQSDPSHSQQSDPNSLKVPVILKKIFSFPLVFSHEFDVFFAISMNKI